LIEWFECIIPFGVIHQKSVLFFCHRFF
jgi:hypothetical protein